MSAYGKFVVWGLARGESDPLHEKILSTQCNDQAAVESIIARAAADGFHSFRVMADNGELPDFVGAINGVRKGRK
jgi:hypothetical protein